MSLEPGAEAGEQRLRMAVGDEALEHLAADVAEAQAFRARPTSAAAAPA
jgi:hypothetical protein